MKARQLTNTLRYVRRSKRASRLRRRPFFLDSLDGTRLSCSLIEGAFDRAVVVAHPAVVDSRQEQVEALAAELARDFTVILFDFRGHGLSSGRCPAGFNAVSLDMEAVVRHARSMGFASVAAAGFSLGAAASLLVMAREPELLDAVVSIGCPPRFPREMIPGRRPLLSAFALRLLGMRVTLKPDEGPDPLDVAPLLPPVPKLLCFGELETSPPEAIEKFALSVSNPREVVTIEGAWHSDLKGMEPAVREWLDNAISGLLV
jgi:pimeloyl-ACP methyl ester carboxylesterase